MAHYRHYTDASGIQHESYEAACEYYGVDTPAQVAAEEAAEEEEWWDHCAVHDYFPAEGEIRQVLRLHAAIDCPF